jgi:hypothetical protein
LTAAVTVIEDLTAVKTAEVHLRILSEAGRALASTSDLPQMLHSRGAGVGVVRPVPGGAMRPCGSAAGSWFCSTPTG